MLNVETATRDGDVDMRVLIELTAISVQGAEYADLNALFTCPLKHGAGGATEQVVEQGPVVTEEGPEQVWHGKGDVLPFAIGQNVLLLSNPLLSGLHAAGAACLRFAALTEEAGMGTVRRGTAVAADAHGAGATG